ncbi:hypothetical protein J2Z79_001924 [Symbiobacterium terraclitae]|uniref:DUF4015 domain-containing protein n=1 Tax=Symbiobacterium terraclitae TaxID=557451 RepID=A0ABS4JSJ0_9FIRM|nr:hypothetical protein [Symbiobacterium terraclitae]
MKRHRFARSLAGAVLCSLLAFKLDPGVVSASPAPSQPAASPSTTAPTAPPAPTPPDGAPKAPVIPSAAEVKGVYLTAWNAANPAFLEGILGLIDRTELNALVVDVKDDSGRVTIATDEATAVAAGAVVPFLPDPRAFTDGLHARGIYAIARIVVFKDPIVAPAHPDWAVHHASGGIWRDWNGVAWLNPYSREAWDYVIRVARAAAEAGFDEIQFDYVRFPTDGDLSATRYPGADGRPYEQVVADFLAHARAELAPLGVLVSADVFGLVTSARDDMGIGQRLEESAGAVDYLSPMLYPSHYERGNLGLPNPNAMPYETVFRSLEDARERIAAAGLSERTAVRPWLQDFSLGHTYGPAEVRAQIQATYDAGYSSWLLWNAANVYTEAALVAGDTASPCCLPAAEVGAGVTVHLDGRQLTFDDVEPFIARSTGQVLVPVRALATALGGTVEWEAASRTARITLGKRTIAVTVGSAGALVDGRPVDLTQPAVLWQGRTLVPLRFVVEGLGARVDWDGAAHRVLMTSR